MPDVGRSRLPITPPRPSLPFLPPGALIPVLTRNRPSFQFALPRARLAAVGLCAALLAGAALRTIWVEDMEYKGDEIWTFERTQHAGVDEPVPTLGMPTSYEVRHPGGTIWVFLAITKIFGVTTPTDLGRACQIVNTLAILLLAGFAYRCVPDREREPWLWAAALASVNPLAVVFHRKIWPPSIVPLFTTLALIGWWHRDRRAGAFFWGLCSVLIGQIHPGGLFLALGFAGWTFLMDRRSVRWGYWIAGCAVATATLIPWLLYALDATGQNPISQRQWSNLVTARFWINWVTEANGISLAYSLGQDFWDYLSQPFVGGVPTYGLAAIHALMIGTGVVILGRAAWSRWRLGWREMVIELTGRTSPTALVITAGMGGFGLAFTLTRLPVHRHYMNLTFPLIYLWLAYLAVGRRGGLTSNPSATADGAGTSDLEPHTTRLTGDTWVAHGRALLVAMCLLQFAVSAGFLAYVHSNQRPIRGDYGTPYRARASVGLSPR